MVVYADGETKIKEIFIYLIEYVHFNFGIQDQVEFYLCPVQLT